VVKSGIAGAVTHPCPSQGLNLWPCGLETQALNWPLAASRAEC